MSAGEHLWLAANATALVLLGAVLAGWARARPRLRLPLLVGVAGLGLGMVVVLSAFGPAQVETGWITVLQEGRSVRNIRQLYGGTTHVGSGFAALTAALADPGVEALRAVVHFNLCLAAANALIFFLLATVVLRTWLGGLAFALGYVCNLNTLHAAFSETPAMLWTTYFWLGCVAAGVVLDDEHGSGRLRLLALLALGLLVVLAASVRLEWLIIGFPAIAIGAARVLGMEAPMRSGVAALGRVVRNVVAGPLWIFLVVVVLLLGLQSLPSWGPAAYVVDGMAPLNMSFLLLPLKLGVFLPIGFIVLFILGTIYTTRHWLRFCLLPIALLTLFKSYSAAAQGNFEHFRYASFVVPGVFYVALFGFRELAEWAQRWTWPPWWRRVALLSLALSMTVWQPLGPRELFGRRQRLPGIADAIPLLAVNQQTEVRYLLDLVTRYPECVFLAKAPRSESVGVEVAGARWAAFGAPLPYFREVPDAGMGLDAVAREIAPSTACVLFYRSLDCSLVEFDGCRAETEGRAAVEERVLENLPFSDIGSYGAHRAEVVLGVYPVLGEPR
ncbi:DUF2079 domain-containing protein [Candidatus Binatia bacterium]|nr:DUF2079 domain-containing protein [Candidatus Binatia bacterium]